MVSSTHSTLAKRLLSHGKDLPPLLNTQLPSDELDAELYDFIALALRAYINPWWSKVTRYDKEFLPEITGILIHVIRNLEERLLAAELAPLVFVDLPTIIATHYRDYRNAADKLSSSYASGGAAPLPHLFHFMQPHMAVSPDGVVDQEYFRQVIDIVLKHTIPPSDYRPDAERFIVREIILKVLVNDVIPKVTQPWFIQKMILDHIVKVAAPSSLLKPTSPQNGQSFSLQTFVVIILSAIQSVSGACLAIIHGYKQTINTIKLVSSTAPQTALNAHLSQPATTMSGSQIPPKDVDFEDDPAATPRHMKSATSSTITSVSSLPSRSPISSPAFIPNPDKILPLNYARNSIVMFSEIFSLNDRLSSATLVTFCTMITSTISHFLDRYLLYMLSAVFSPAFVLNAIRSGKATLFPNGYPSSNPADPSPEEQAEIRSLLVNWRPKGAVAHVFPWLLGTDPSKTLDEALEPLNSQPCNVHLLVIILDRVFCVLFPELMGVSSS